MNYTPKLQYYRVWFWQYVSLAVSFTNFLCFHNANYYAFISAWWNSCRKSCTAGLLVLNSFSFVCFDIFSISFFISEEQICWVQYSSLTGFFFLSIFEYITPLSPGLQSLYWEVPLNSYGGDLHVVTHFLLLLSKSPVSLTIDNLLTMWFPIAIAESTYLGFFALHEFGCTSLIPCLVSVQLFCFKHTVFFSSSSQWDSHNSQLFLFVMSHSVSSVLN